MSDDAIQFDVYPKVVPADAETTITVRPAGGAPPFGPAGRYEVTYFPTEEFALSSGWPEKNKPAFRIEDGAMKITQFFEAEQEHVLLIEAVTGDRDGGDGEKRTPAGNIRVYSLAADLHARKPFKGDFHLHSNRSDGREEPAEVAACSRAIGLDFMAVTDHRRYAPSIEAIDAFAGLETDLAMVPGEEVHPPDNPVHMIHFGGRFSVNDLFAGDAYRAEVAAIEKSLGELPAGVSRYQYASCVWVFEKIRQAGGLGVFCHPYWFTQNRYAPSGAITSALLANQPFDAFELIGGFHRFEVDSNTLQVARYHHEQAQGRRVPIVGASDAHGCHSGKLFGWYYTILFARSTALADIIEAVKGFHSVAVEALPGEAPRAHGPFRLVKYAMFLIREVFPAHDELCAREGKFMLAHLAGDKSAAEALGERKGQVAKLMARLCGV